MDALTDDAGPQPQDLLTVARRLDDRATADEILGKDYVPVARQLLTESVLALRWAYSEILEKPTVDEQAASDLADLRAVTVWLYIVASELVDVPGTMPTPLAETARFLWDESFTPPGD